MSQYVSAEQRKQAGAELGQAQLQLELGFTLNKLGLSWAKLSSSWNYALLQLICIEKLDN